jgi:cell division protein FtsA
MENLEAQTEVVVYVGTHKLIALEGTFEKSDPLILRHAVLKNPEGFEKGLITNLERAATSLETLLNNLLPGRTTEVAPFVVLGNSKLKTYTFSSSQYYQGYQRTVTSQEIRSVVSQTRSVATLPLTEFVLQAIPDSFLVNDTDNITNPLGLDAHRLGVNLKIYTMNFQDFKNISKAFEAAEIEVKGYFPKTLTASEAILNEHEKENASLVIDLADDAAYLTLWKNGHSISNKIIPQGGKWLTTQIAKEWGIELQDAERVKEQYGSLEAESKAGEELIPLIERNGTGKQAIHRQVFHEKFLEQGSAWLEAILQEADAFSKENNVHYPHVIFTGGGTCLDGFLEFLQKKFSRIARIGLTRRVEAPNELLVDPSAVGALGLYRWLANHMGDQRRLLEPSGFLQKTLASAREWFAAYF